MNLGDNVLIWNKDLLETFGGDLTQLWAWLTQHSQ